MGYMVIEDFSGGLDTRKRPVSARAGTLQTLKNAFINSGNEIEKRKAFSGAGTLPDVTLGLGFFGTEIVTFGTTAAATVDPSMPDYTRYLEITQIGGEDPDYIADVAIFGDQLVVIAHYPSTGENAFLFDNTYARTDLGDIGTNARAHEGRLYVVDGIDLKLSVNNDPSDFSGTGSGTIDVRTYDANITSMIGIEKYYNSLALLGQNAIQIWATDADPAQHSLLQTLDNIGVVSAQAAAAFGTGDLLFLSNTGVRSLRARDSSNNAVLTDIGAPIDPTLQNLRAAMTSAEARKITALVDPLTGQFWLIWGRYIYVLSYWPGTGVAAWSVYDVGTEIVSAVVAGARVVLRTAGDDLLVYGTYDGAASPWLANEAVGLSAENYDSSTVTVVTPMLDHGAPATEKVWQGLDVACSGTWEVYACPDPRNPTAFVKVTTITDETLPLERIPLDMKGTHIALKFVSQGSTRATISSIMLHDDLAEAT